MDRELGVYIFLGLVIGAMLGVFLGKAIGNSLLGIGIGALTGIFIGWFSVAAVLENRKDRS